MTIQVDNAGGRETWAERAAALIRERSAAAELISGEELQAFLATENLAVADATQEGDAGEARAAAFARLLEANEDLRKITEADSCTKNTGFGTPFYYSSLYLTEAYARLLAHKRAGPRQLIAATVRDYAGAYRRPLTVEMFTQPPFLFTAEEIRACLDLMAQTEDYEDIAATAASTGGIYLYSTRFLDEDHAAMLAEWLDAGQAANP
jgi:hypothetical protein